MSYNYKSELSKHMRVIFLAIFTILIGCNPTPEIPNPSKVPTGKGKIHGTLNERKMQCRLVKVERSQDLQGAWSCIYDHPKSDVHDVVTVGESNMCPNMVFCDKR